MRNAFADSYHWSKRIWAPNPFVVLLRKAQTDLAIRIWTILVPIRLKKPEKNGFGPFSYKFFVCIRVGLSDRMLGIKGSADHSRWTCVDRPSCSVDKKLRNNALHRKCLRKRRLPASAYMFSLESGMTLSPTVLRTTPVQ